jgi:adenylosuccinate synthase
MSNLNNVAILGSFLGDEAKARCVHALASNYRYIVRFSSGPNAGHTVYVDGIKNVFNQVPSVDFRQPHCRGFLGSGMVINLEALRDELLNLQKNYPHAASCITVDPDAFLVLPKHVEEDKAKNGHIGSTKKGVGPAYTEKVSRSGTKVKDYLDSNSDITNELKSMGVQFKYVLEMYDELSSSKVIFEGAQGILLDLNAGTYPYVSCGDSTLAGIHSSGFSFIAPKTVYGVAKAYSTKVGEGPYPTEYFGQQAEELRRLGDEYGAVSGRPRRVGALDLPALRYAKKRGGINKLIITKLDILNGCDNVAVCHKYKNEAVSGSSFFNAEPEYVYFEGWKDASDPDQIRPFIEFIEYETGMRVDYVSFGVGAEDFVKWND